MTIDVEKVRAETPGADEVIHFNAAGAALMSNSVINAQKNHIDLEARIGGYEAADRAREAADRIYGAAAELLKCRPDEIACVENATAAWTQAFYGMAAAFKPGDRILTAAAEYGANYVAYLQARKRTGCVIEVVPNGEDGRLDVAAMSRTLEDTSKGPVRLISITHVPTNGGLVNPAAEVGALARRFGVPYLLDACQSAGQMPLDVNALNCDFLSAAGRKFLRGPRGSGFLYARRSMFDRFEPGCLDHFGALWTGVNRYALVDSARRYENWEFNYAARIGLGVAIDEALALGLENIQARLNYLSDYLRAGLGGIPGVAVRDLGPSPCAVITFTVEDRPAADVKAALAGANINVSVSDIASTRLDMAERGLEEVVRASPHVYTRDDECDMLIAEVAKTAAG